MTAAVRRGLSLTAGCDARGDSCNLSRGEGRCGFSRARAKGKTQVASSSGRARDGGRDLRVQVGSAGGMVRDRGRNITMGHEASCVRRAARDALVVNVSIRSDLLTTNMPQVNDLKILTINLDGWRRSDPRA